MEFVGEGRVFGVWVRLGAVLVGEVLDYHCPLFLVVFQFKLFVFLTSLIPGMK